MQSPYLTSQPGWLTNLLNATRLPPFGLADPREPALSETPREAALFGEKMPSSGTLGSALGRTAGPVGGALALTYDLCNSDNKLRTAIADGFGILGSTIGGTVGTPVGPAGIAAGLVGGGYAGYLIGGSLYDLAAYSYAHPEIYGDPVFLATY